jgi:secreted Zn-dependent insulinase-like peptidase
LGYIVFATGMPIKDVAGSVLVVQSPTASVADLQQEISGFLATQVFDEKSLAQNKQAVISNLLEAPKNLVEQSEHYWSNIVHEVSSFDRNERLAKQVEAVSLASLQAYFTSMVEHQSRQMWLTASRQSAEEVSATVGDVQTFKASKPHYPFP